MVQQNNLRVAITGANGFVAKNVRNYLHKSGLNLISISRKNFKTYLGERKIILSNFEQKNILSKVKNCNVLIHLIGTWRQTTDSTFENVNVNQTKIIIKICKKTKIKKIIYISGLGVLRN